VEKALAGFVVAVHVSSRQRFCVQTPEDESHRFVVSTQNISQAIFTEIETQPPLRKIRSVPLQENNLIKPKFRQYGATEAASVIDQ
jgi:hypothetical protein